MTLRGITHCANCHCVFPVGARGPVGAFCSRRCRSRYYMNGRQPAPPKCKVCNGPVANYQQHCSPDCRAASNYRARARRRVAGDAAIETVRRDVVFKRDGWKCQLCGARVRDDLPALSPRRANLDHIIPIAAGGEHTYANTQCLCRSCNVRKNARKIGQLRLA